MIIVCKKCGFRKESLIIDKMIALKELTNALMEHAAKKHHEDLEALKKLIGPAQLSLAWTSSMVTFAFVPETEEFILGELEKNMTMLMGLLGFDPGEEDTEDDGDDEDELEGEEENEDTEPEDDGIVDRQNSNTIVDA